MTTDENINIVQADYAAFQRGDIAALLSTLDENVEWVTPQSVPLTAAGKLHGPKQVAEFFQSVGQAWDFEVFEPREFIASGNTVTVAGYYRARARATGRIMASDWMMKFRFDGSKISHFQEYTDTAVLRDALTAQAAA